MPLQKHTPPLPRILLETLAGALCLFTLPLAFGWLGQAIHGQGGGGRAAVLLCLCVLGILFLLDVYRMMRQRSAAPSKQSDENTGSNSM